MVDKYLIKLLNKSILIFIVLSFAMNNLYGQFTTQDSGVNVSLHDIYLVDSINGWTVGDSGTILQTIDGGDNWAKQISPIDSETFGKVKFLNQSDGYILSNQGSLLKTKDGGANWIKIEIGYEYEFTDFSFISPNVGWISGSFETMTERFGAVLHTTDGGQTWSQQLDLKSKELNTGAVFVSSVEFLNDTLGWAVVGGFMDNFDNILVYHSNNGGVDWEKIGETNFLVSIIEILSKDTIWLGGLLGFERSFDGGINWLHTTNQITPNALLAINETEGWAITYHLLTKVAKLVYTIDGGSSWELKYQFDKSVGLGLSNYLDKYLWIVGENGMIIKRDITISAIEDYMPISSDFELYQNYPNPFNPKTTIDYSIAKEGLVKLGVYDLLGREVRTLVRDFQNAGSYIVEFDASQLPSGIYLYRLKSGSYSETKKLIILK